jgi:glycosyltransferase involved in cell wall biosynthesis
MRRLRASAHGFERECLSKKIIATHFAFYALPMLAQLRRNRHIVHFHGPWADETRDQGGRPHIVLAKRSIERIVYSTANSFITLSQAFKQLLIKRFAVTPDRIAVIPGGIDTDRFNIATTQAAARDRLGWPRDRQIIVCVRRLIARKGLEELIAAIKEVKQSIPNALFLIAGSEGSQSALRVKIAEAQLSGCAEVLGFVPDDDLALVYRAADLSIVPSQKLEGFGLVTIESLAAGTPVLVTPVDGLPEAVGGLSKRLVLGGSSASHLAAGLIDALRGTTPLPGQRECHDYVRNNFDWSVIAPRILNAYRPAE